MPTKTSRFQLEKLDVWSKNKALHKIKYGHLIDCLNLTFNKKYTVYIFTAQEQNELQGEVFSYLNEVELLEGVDFFIKEEVFNANSIYDLQVVILKKSTDTFKNALKMNNIYSSSAFYFDKNFFYIVIRNPTHSIEEQNVFNKFILQNFKEEEIYNSPSIAKILEENSLPKLALFTFVFDEGSPLIEVKLNKNYPFKSCPFNMFKVFNGFFAKKHFYFPLIKVDEDFKKRLKTTIYYLKEYLRIDNDTLVNIQKRFSNIVAQLEINAFLNKTSIDEIEDTLNRKNAYKKIKDKILNILYDIKTFSEKNLNISLYDFQIIGTYFLLKNKHALLADKMGTGKTIQALAAVEYKKLYPCLIVSPNTLKFNQEYEIKRIFKDEIKTFVISGRKKEDEILKSFDENNRTIFIINYDIVDKYKNLFSKIKFKCIILDEAHFVKNKKAKRTKAIDYIIKSVNPEYLFLLTGTPILGNAMELVNLLELAGLINKYYITKTNFIRTFFQSKKTQQGCIYNIKDYKILSKTIKSLAYLSRKKEDVLKQLPDKVRNIIYIQPSDTEQKQYNLLYGEVVKNIKDLSTKITNRHKLTIESLAELNKLRQLNSKIKTEYFKNQIDIFFEDNPNEKIVIFAYFKRTQNEIYEYLKRKYNNAIKLTADMNAEERQHIIRQFQENDDIKVIVISLMTGKEGITLTKAKYAVFIDLDWTPANLLQAEDRIHRIGQKYTVFIYYMIVKNSIDEYIQRKLNQKTELINNLLDNNVIDEILRDILKTS